MYNRLTSLTLRLLVLLICTVGLIGCGDDSSQPAPITQPGEEDTPSEPTPDTSASDEGGEEDTEGSESSAVEDAGAEDATEESDIQLVEVGCPNGQTSCLDKNGLNDPFLCAGEEDTVCTDGCCVPVFKCSEDDDCNQFAGNADMGCPDERFDCGCNEETGACFLFVCNTTSDCEGERICVSGVCEPPMALQKLRARVTSNGAVVTTGTSVQLAATGYDTENNSQSLTGLEFEWNTSNGEAVSVTDSGIVTGGEILGQATISVRVKGGETTWSEGVVVSNVGSATEGAVLRVVAVSERTSQLLEGSVLAQSEGATYQASIVNGVAEFFELTLPADVHVFADNHHATSVYGVNTSDVVIHSAAPFAAELVIAKDETMTPEDQTFVGDGDLLTGALDYTNYSKEGEIELGITGMGVDQGLFAFNFGLLVGPDVKRYFDQDLPAGMFDSNAEQQLPGGVTFSLGYPVLSSYWLAGGAGSQSVWSLGGRVGLNDSGVGQKISDIVASVDGGSSLEIGEIVATLLPLFETFYSGVSTTVLETDPNFEEPTVLDNVLTLPLSNGLEVTAPDLLSLGEGMWADTLLLIGGAMSSDRRFVPLGITAGTDTDSNNPVADGKVDGNPSTIAPDNFRLFLAPTHHELQTDSSQMAVVSVAAVLEEGDDRPEAGSGIVTLLDLPAAGPKPNGSLDVTATGDFLPVIQGASWNASGARLLALPGVAEGEDHFRRVMFENEDGSQWHVFIPGDIDNVVIPDPSLAETPLTDYAGSATHFVVNDFDPRGSSDGNLQSLYAPGGNNLNDLLSVIERASYIREKVASE